MADVFEFTALEPPQYLAADNGTVEDRLTALAAEAERRGFDEGLARGLAEARAQAAGALEAVAAAERAMAELRDSYLARAEAAAVELAFQIAEKVIGATVAADPEAVLGVVSGALLRTTDRDHLVVEVNPAGFRARPRRGQRAGGASGRDQPHRGHLRAPRRAGRMRRSHRGGRDRRAHRRADGAGAPAPRRGAAVGRRGRRRARRCLTPSRIGPLPPTLGRSPRPTCSVTAAVSST